MRTTITYRGARIEVALRDGYLAVDRLTDDDLSTGQGGLGGVLLRLDKARERAAAQPRGLYAAALAALDEVAAGTCLAAQRTIDSAIPVIPVGATWIGSADGRVEAIGREADLLLEAAGVELWCVEYAADHESPTTARMWWAVSDKYTWPLKASGVELIGSAYSALIERTREYLRRNSPPRALRDNATEVTAGIGRLIEDFVSELRSDLAGRAYRLDEDPDEVTWAELAAVNEADTMAEVFALGVGESTTLGQCDRIRRVR